MPIMLASDVSLHSARGRHAQLSGRITHTPADQGCWAGRSMLHVQMVEAAASHAASGLVPAGWK